MARDWLKTLWRSSYKGTPFWVETDGEDGGRRLVVHQKPNADRPFIEDLGEDKRDFEVTAYVASDQADSEAKSLMATCATKGIGVLVLPTHGPLKVRCVRFKRSREKDKHGYIAFSLNFIRDDQVGAAAGASPAMLANSVFVAADGAVAAIAASFVGGIVVGLQPDFVVAAASGGAQTAIATLEAIRTSEPVDPIVSAAQRVEIQAIYDAAPALVASADATLPARIVAAFRAVGYGLPAASAVTAFDAVVADSALAVMVSASASGVVVNPYPTPLRRLSAVNDAAAKRLLLLAALTAYCEAIARLTLSDRPAAITLRANVAEYVDGLLAVLPAAEIALFHAVVSLRDAVIDYLSRAVLDLAPVITVEANLSMPSLYWSWRLYATPKRASEIVARNLIPHPSFMPPVFEALAR